MCPEPERVAEGFGNVPEIMFLGRRLDWFSSGRERMPRERGCGEITR